MNLYHILYLNQNMSQLEMFVVASTANNAWAQCQVSDTTATTLVTVDEQMTGVIVGS